MKANKASSVEDFKIATSFQAVRKQLLDEKFSDRWEKPLAYWALPNDRRLPLAFMDRTIRDLLHTPFEELSATPGIGQKKITSLVKLLNRATKDDPPGVPIGGGDDVERRRSAAARAKRENPGFDPAIVSEALWSQWRETVQKHGVGGERLGRLAPTLQALPTVIWQTPLNTYLNYSVAEIRQLKTHGEKRVRVVLEVFSIVHDILADSGTHEHLSVRLVPRFIEPMERWISEWMDKPGLPSDDEVCDALTVPLLRQILIDSGQTIFELAAGRLGACGELESVRQQSKRLDVTRARVYQLLEDCAKVMRVRWPEGRAQLYALIEKLRPQATQADDLKVLLNTVELFFPRKDKEANGHLAGEQNGHSDVEG
jgi:hypothetical protein